MAHGNPMVKVMAKQLGAHIGDRLFLWAPNQWVTIESFEKDGAVVTINGHHQLNQFVGVAIIPQAK